MLHTSHLPSGLMFQRARLSPSLEGELSPLLAAHHEEVTPYPDIRLEVDWPTYRQAEQAGMFTLFTARMTVPAALTDAPGLYAASDRLVGYAGFFVRHAPHYLSSKVASEDVVFMEMRYRGHFAEFTRWCDARLREDGVQTVLRCPSTARDFGEVLSRMGYDHVGWLYSRRLDD